MRAREKYQDRRSIDDVVVELARRGRVEGTRLSQGVEDRGYTAIIRKTRGIVLMTRDRSTRVRVRARNMVERVRAKVLLDNIELRDALPKDGDGGAMETLRFTIGNRRPYYD